MVPRFLDQLLDQIEMESVAILCNKIMWVTQARASILRCGSKPAPACADIFDHLVLLLWDQSFPRIQGFVGFSYQASFTIEGEKPGPAAYGRFLFFQRSKNLSMVWRPFGGFRIGWSRVVRVSGRSVTSGQSHDPAMKSITAVFLRSTCTVEELIR